MSATHVAPPTYKSLPSPRHKFIQTQRQERSSTFTEVLGGPAFSKRIESFLTTSLESAHSDSDRIFVYQRAFDMLAGEFQLCRPLLERIKQQYDTVSRKLLAKKREISTDTSSISAAEENFSEAVSQLRRARAQEFAQNRAESEKLLDRMTELRLERSELLKQIEALVTRREELQQCEVEFEEQIAATTEKVESMTEEVRKTEVDVREAKQAVKELKEEIGKAETASADLASKAESLKTELGSLEQELEASKSRLFDLNQDSGKIESQTNGLKHDIETLQAEKEAALQHRKNAKEKHDQLEKELRKLLKDETTPLNELCKNCV